MDYKPLSKREESIAEKIVDAAYTVHKILGPGLLEKVLPALECKKHNQTPLTSQAINITIDSNFYLLNPTALIIIPKY